MVTVTLFRPRSEISCKSLEGQEGLRQLIFHVTCGMKDVGSTIGCQRLVGRLVGTPLVHADPEGPASRLWGVCACPSLHRVLVLGLPGARASSFLWGGEGRAGKHGARSGRVDRARLGT